MHFTLLYLSSVLGSFDMTAVGARVGKGWETLTWMKSLKKNCKYFEAV